MSDKKNHIEPLDGDGRPPVTSVRARKKKKPPIEEVTQIDRLIFVGAKAFGDVPEIVYVQISLYDNVPLILNSKNAEPFTLGPGPDEFYCNIKPDSISSVSEQLHGIGHNHINITIKYETGRLCISKNKRYEV